MIIQFHSVLEALSYHKFCPCCKNSMEVNDRDLVTEYSNRGNSRLAFELSSSSDDVMFIDPVSEEIEIVVNRYIDNSNRYVMGNYSGTVNQSNHPYIHVANGFHFSGLTVACNSCCRFDYRIQIRIDLQNKKVAGVVLNSETISWEDEDKMLHEIKNIYPVNKTYYSYFVQGAVDKKIDLPLVPLNLSNPKETVDRIKTLIVFS